LETIFHFVTPGETFSLSDISLQTLCGASASWIASLPATVAGHLQRLYPMRHVGQAKLEVWGGGEPARPDKPIASLLNGITSCCIVDGDHA